VNKRHFVGLHLLLIVGKNVQELDGVDWKIHVDVIRILKLFLIGIFLLVDLAHRLTGAHVPAFNAILHFIELAIGH
jgi:hypothetical protein